MLVALAVTLVMMAAVVNLFANISGSIRNRRAMIEVGGQLRQVRQRLALDLEGATCAAKTWQLPGENRGYIEIIEGQYSDANPSMFLDGTLTATNRELDYATSVVPSGGDPQIVIPTTSTRTPAVGDVTNGGALGDADDILALTVRSEAEPFRASVLNETTGVVEMQESTLAEVLWFARENDDPTTAADESNGGSGMRTIYRRVLLIVPSLGPWTNQPENVSARFDTATNRWVANTLGDLTKRENRVERRVGPADPFPFPISGMGSSTTNERIVLSNALAFDVRVFDPGAPLMDAAGGTIVQPGDPGWPDAAVAFAALPDPPDTPGSPPGDPPYEKTPPGCGAYVDLGWAIIVGSSNLSYPPTATYALPLNGMDKLSPDTPSPKFHVPHLAGWHPSDPLNLTVYPATYDTWSYHYENDGIDQDQIYAGRPAWRTNTLDQGANGLDDDNLNGVDDMGERETSPPYNTPLRGVKVVLRIYETDARQIRETSVTHAFE